MARPWQHGQVESIGIFTAVKMTHLSDDETVAKMGHPIVVERSDVGHPSNRDGMCWSFLFRPGSVEDNGSL